MAFTMRHSDNSLAEEFGRLLALQVGADNSPAGAVQAVKSVLERKGITTTGLDMRNCSGLTEDSKLTARTLLEVQLRNLAAGSGAAASGADPCENRQSGRRDLHDRQCVAVERRSVDLRGDRQQSHRFRGGEGGHRHIRGRSAEAVNGHV